MSNFEMPIRADLFRRVILTSKLRQIDSVWYAIMGL